MVAENPLSNGDDRGPSLRPKSPNSTNPIATPLENIITAMALLATKVENLKNPHITTTEYNVEKTSTAKQARNPPTMAKFNPTPSSEPSNHISANPPRAKPSILRVDTPPLTPPLDIFSVTRENKENTENSSFQYFQDPHGHSSPKSRFAPAPPS